LHTQICVYLCASVVYSASFQPGFIARNIRINYNNPLILTGELLMKNLFNKKVSALIITGSFITPLAVSQIDWVNHFYSSMLGWAKQGDPAVFFNGMFFRVLMSGIIGFALGALYLKIISLFIREKPEDLKKHFRRSLTLAHLPAYLYWLYLLKIEISGLILNNILTLAIILLCWLLAEVLFFIPRSIPDWKTKIRGSLVISSFFSLTLLFFLPLQIFLTNQAEFSFNLIQLAAGLVPVCAFMIVFITRITLLFPLKAGAYQRSIAVLFAVSLAVWAQGNIMIWNYGPLDGRVINWNGMLFNGILDALVWIIVIAVAAVKPVFTAGIARKASLFFILMQVFFLGLVAFQKAPEASIKNPGGKDLTVDYSGEFTYSKNTNIMVIILDSFQSDIFSNIITENPEVRGWLDGFTYFPNSTGGFSSTVMEPSFILTGRQYDNDVPFPEFIRKAFRESSIIRALKDNQYRVELYPYGLENVYFDPLTVSNIKLRSDPFEIIKELCYIYDTALFRSLPHFLKRFVYNNSKWFLYNAVKNLQIEPSSRNTAELSRLPFSKFSTYKSENLKFFYDFTRLSYADYDKACFKFYHIKGAHTPIYMNDKLDAGFFEFTRVNYKKQGLGLMRLMKLFFDRLKNMGIYDNSMIFILADHGNGGLPDMQINPRSKTLNENDKARGVPIILAKRFREKGGLKTSHAPVSLSDIPATISAELMIKASFPGYSLYSLNENTVRTRIYRAYENTDGFYLMTLREYLINGNSWDDSSWKFNRFIPPLR
jgi:hypothetical protein